MKRFRFVVLAVITVAALIGGGCFRKDIVTVEIHIPQMRTTECANRVVRILTSVDPEAIIRVETNVERLMARVTYNSTRMALKNIEHLLTSAGFDANEASAPLAARANLPEECR